MVHGTAEAPTVNILRLNALRETNTAFLTPKSYDKQSCPFYIEVPLLGAGRGRRNFPSFSY